MMLVVETSTSACSVALFDGDRVHSRYSDQPRSHSRLVLSMIETLLEDTQVTLDAIDCLCVTVGPGSFTGLRIGFAIVQGLAFARDLPVVAVSTLETLAASYRRRKGVVTGDLVIAVLDARMEQFSLGGYRWTEDGWLCEINDRLVGIDIAVQCVEESAPAVVIGDASALSRHISGPLSANAGLFIDLYPNAIDLGALALPRRQQALPIQSIELCYLRDSGAWVKQPKVG